MSSPNSPNAGVSIKNDPMTLMATWGQLEENKAESGFEGPEKRLEINLKSFGSDANNKGLRALPQSDWEEVVGILNAKIVSHVANEYIDSYVLTESSLFVTREKIILITCGTTTLLVSVPKILSLIESIGGRIEWASFMRKNYSFPWQQKEPHASMESEYATLSDQFPGGSAFIFGPVDSDHYFLYVYDVIERPTEESDTQFSVTMYGMDKEVASAFFSDKFYSTSEETRLIREKTRLCELLEGWTVQDLQFEPCGYSINAIKGNEYQTMHITPEDDFSFASYETNSPLENFHERLSEVLKVFKPKRFTTILLLDPHSPVGMQHKNRKPVGVEPKGLPGYRLLNRTINQFNPGYSVMKLNYVEDK